MAGTPDEPILPATMDPRLAERQSQHDLHLARRDEERVLEAIAENPNTRPETLAGLAAGGRGFVRQKVARNRRTPHATLRQLAENPQLRARVARNPALLLELV